MDSIQKTISDIQLSGYPKAKLQSFLENHTFPEIFEQALSSSDEKFETNFLLFISSILRFTFIAERFLMDSSPPQRSLLKALLSHESEQWRGLPGAAVDSYLPQLTAYLCGGQDEVIEEFLVAIFTQLSDESTSVGLKALNNLQKMVKESKKYDYKVAKSSVFNKYVDNGLKSADTVIAMRYLDLAIYVTNESEVLFALYQERNFGELVLKMYKTDDLLVKLAMVESIQKMGDSSWNAKFIASSSLYKAIVDECFDKNGDLYVQKNLLVLLAKMVARGIIPFDMKLKNNVKGMLLGWLVSGYNEEVQAALDVVSNLVLRREGVEMMLNNSELMKAFYCNSYSSKDTLKKRFLFAISQIFNPELDPSKDSALLKKALTLLGDIFDIMNNKITIMELSKDLTKSFDYIFKLLFLPFTDIELEAINLVKELLKHSWAIPEFCRQEKSMKYLTEQPAKGKEILDAKMEIIKDLIEKISVPEQTDIHLIQYAKRLTEFAKLKSQKTQDVTYETDLL